MYWINKGIIYGPGHSVELYATHIHLQPIAQGVSTNSIIRTWAFCTDRVKQRKLLFVQRRVMKAAQLDQHTIAFENWKPLQLYITHDN